MVKDLSFFFKKTVFEFNLEKLYGFAFKTHRSRKGWIKISVKMN